MNWFRSVVTALILAGTLSAQNNDSLATEIELHTYLEQDEVPMNREVIYHVELTWPGELNRYHIFEISEPAVTNLKLRGSGSANRFFTDENGRPQSVKRITYYFTPQSTGMAYIDGVTIQYQDQQLSQSETLLAQRLGVKIIAAEEESAGQTDSGQILLILIVAGFVLVLGYFLWRYYKLQSARSTNEEQTVETAEQRTLKLVSEKMDQAGSDTRQAFSHLTRLLNQYLAGRFELEGPVDFKSVQPYFEKLNVSENVQQKLIDLYRQAELSKFAGEAISESELHLYRDTVEMLLQELSRSREEEA